MTTSRFTTIRTVMIACGMAMTAAACSATQPQSTVSRGLDSGVTSSSGGGMTPANFGSAPPVKAP